MLEASLSRTDEIRQIHTDYRNFYRLLAGGTLVTLGIVIGAVLFSGDISGYFVNLYTDAVGVILTIGVLNYLQERREERRRIKDLQDELIREAGSSVNATARTAIDTMRKRGWLYRVGVKNHTVALMSKSDLSGANLQDANLSFANVSGADLQKSNLSGANLEYADLGKVNFRRANLSKAKLQFADLRDAHLRFSDLTGANMRVANLSGADLRNTSLKNASLHDADLSGAIITSTTKFDENTILPNGKKWFPECDWSEFGVERQDIVNDIREVDNLGEVIRIVVFADGVQRRWKLGEGWLDDRDGNPLS